MREVGKGRKKVSGACFAPVAAGGWFPLGGAAVMFFQIHWKKRCCFLLLLPAGILPPLAACLTSGSRLKVAARGVLAALAEFWFSGTVRNTPFLRLEPKTPRRTCKGGKQPAAVPGKGRAKPGTKHLSQAPHQRPLPNPGGEGGRDGGRPHFPPENFTN